MHAQLAQAYEVIVMTDALRDSLLEVLTDEDLTFTITGNPSLCGVLNHLAGIQRCYTESFRTHKLDFAGLQDPSQEVQSVAGFRETFRALDAGLKDALERLAPDQPIDRGGWKPSAVVNLHTYREAELIVYAKISVYLKALGKHVPGDWDAWIG